MSTQRPSDKDLNGMTVNERLVVCGKIDLWDKAVARRDRDAIIEVLRDVALDESQAVQTTDTVLMNPSRYGF